MKGRYPSLAASGAALCLTAVTLTGCGAVEGLAKDNEVTLRVVAADYGDNPQNSSTAYWKGLADGFEKANPGVNVEVSVYSWSEVDAKVAAMVKAGNAPDIAQIGAYADYAAAGKLYSAEELLSVRTEADFLEPLADAGKVKRVQYGLPFVASTRLLFYNEKLLTDAGVIGKDAKAAGSRRAGPTWRPRPRSSRARASPPPSRCHWAARRRRPRR